MWYMWQFGGMIFQLFEAIIDKKIIKKTNLSDYQTSFLRLSVYSSIIMIFAYIYLNEFQIIFNRYTLFIGIFGVISSLIYSNLVKEHDITILVIVPIVMPIFFYICDYFILNVHLTIISTLSLIISMFGSYIYFKNHILMTKKLIYAVSYMVFYTLSEFYILKLSNLNPMIFFGNTTMISAICLAIYLILKQQFSLNLFDKNYILGSSVSKLFDVLLTICYGYAMILTTGLNFSIFQLLFAPFAMLVTFIMIKLKLIHYEYLHLNTNMIIGLLLLIIGELIMFLS